MAKLRELIIKISANSSSYQAEIARASRLGENYHRVMANGNRSATAAARGSTAALRDLNNQLVSVKASAMGMAGSFAGIFATSKLIETADKWTNLNSRLKLATQSSMDLANSQRLLMAMSQKTGTSFEANATVFARAAAPMRALKYASQDIVNMTEVLSTGLRISGASASESSSVLIQFSQAMSSGVLRGEEFNAMAENGSRIIQALADGLGVARTKLKGMADNGLLTMDKVIPALLSQLEKLKAEGLSMGATVEKSLTRVQNAFMQWVGGANESTGTTRVLSGVLDDLSKNLNDVAAAGMVAAGLFGARALGNRVSAIQASTSALIQNTKAEINNANQAYHNSRIQVENARATERQTQRNVLAARSALLRTTNEQQFAAAQSRLNRAIEAQAKAHAIVTQSITARKAAQAQLNAVTSAGRRMGSALLGAVGGIPGAAILAGSAIYYLHQQQEQAKQSALELRNNTELLTDALKAMSSLEVKKRIFDTQDDIDAQKDAIEKQKQLVEARKMDVERLRIVSEKGVKTLYSASPVEQLTEATRIYNNEVNNLALMQEGLNRKQNELNQLQSRQVGLFRDNYVEMLRTSDILPMLTLAGSDFNRILSAGNTLLQQRRELTSVPFAPPPAPLDDKQKDFLKKSERDLALSSLQGEDKIRKQAEFAAEDQRLNTPEHQDNYQKYLNNTVAAYRNGEKAREAQAAAAKAASEAAKVAREAAAAQENYSNKVAELNTQLETEGIRYKEGNTAAELFAASQGNVSKFTKEQNSHLNQLNKTLEEAKQRYQDLQAAIEADPFRNVAKRTKEAADQLARQKATGQIQSPAEYDYRKGEIWKDEVRGNADAKQQYAVSARDALRGDVDPIQDIENQLARKKALYEAYATETLIGEQRKNELILAAERDTDTKRFEAAKQLFASQGDLQSLAVTMFETTQERMGNMITGLLTGTKSLREGMSELFASLAQDVVKSLVKMATQALITNTIMKGMESAGGGGGMFSGIASMLTKNAKGGVYDSPSLSAYRNQIVSSPTMFAFAKGAGLMGEAGPEAIMPLTRGADGSLGVRVITPKGLDGNGKGNVNINVYITDGKAESSASKGDNEAFGRRFAQAVAQVYYTERDRDLRQGGAINKAIRGGR
ncbi:tape measure protein [Xenorhabdus sp. DI]|uniref:tape measure protein n=1 Tax=Xenorhabdus doucetiae TaxID=351671 RepID=UPI0019AC28A9|nr:MULTISPECIES: tape measure protein [unclassified Xenorhabdus]MBD2786204.1 tape measure protein [Xenorhabdus sp. 3]MBD2790281.1 tape measure protein [Xenorhabdus sp. DI]